MRGLCRARSCKSSMQRGREKSRRRLILRSIQAGGAGGRARVQRQVPNVGRGRRCRVVDVSEPLTRPEGNGASGQGWELK